MNSLDIQEILEYLPHRYPFLLIDRVVDYVDNKSLIAYKNVSVNEPFFTGHFPERPIFPGVLIMEAMAQATGLLAFKSTQTKPSDGKLYYFAGIDNCRFKQPVVPGDQLYFEVEVIKARRGIWKFHSNAKVDGKIVASADLMCAEQNIA